ncbi:hypothetical protein ES708_29780 [subsurface metagenome]
MVSHNDSPVKLSLIILLQVFLRSFFIQGSFSAKYRQNVGFAFCMEPVGKYLYKDKNKRLLFTERHMKTYNGNPFMVTLVLGAVAKMEESLLNGGDISEEDVIRFKKMAGPATGAVGDRYFWSTLRPFCLIAGLLITLIFGIWGALVFLGVFNVTAISLRLHWLRAGYRLGPNVIGEIKNRRLESVVNRMDTFGAAVIVFFAILYMKSPEYAHYWIWGATIFFFSLGMVLLRKLRSLTLTFSLSIAVAITFGLFTALYLACSPNLFIIFTVSTISGTFRLIYNTKKLNFNC